MKYTTPQKRVAELVKLHGSYGKASRATGVSKGLLHNIESGRQSHTIRKVTADKLGLEIVYRVKKSV